MAKNWKVAEAVNAIRNGDKDAIADIGRRFPLFVVNAATVNDGAMGLIEAIPEFITVRKMESVLKKGVDDSEVESEEDEIDEEEEEVKPKKEKKEEKVAKKKAKKDEEEEEEEVKPKKKKAKKAEKPSKKKKVDDDDEDDDDDFDFD